MKITLLSSKGQITIPREMQIALQIGHKSKLALYSERGMLLVKPLRSSLVEQTAGSLRSFIPKEKIGIPFDTVREETQKIVAKKLVKV